MKIDYVMTVEEYKQKLSEITKKYDLDKRKLYMDYALSNAVMTLEEYKQKLSEITKKYDLDKRKLYMDYALSNNAVKIGDIVTDHMGSVLVEKISICLPFGRSVPECLYSGIVINKNGKPSKRSDNIRNVYQSNLLVKK